jgi:Arc/MetJ-type ribon-helix-helix transcriptional regulator
MGRWKKYPDLERRILESLELAPEGRRYTELFRELKPGSKSTLSQCVRSLVSASLIEHDYLTETFKITDQGKQVLRKTQLKQRDMQFLVESGIFKTEDGAVEAAIHLWLGVMKARMESPGVLNMLPVRIDKEGNMLRIPETERDWQRLEKTSSLMHKVGRDVEEELLQTLRVFVKRYRAAAAMVLCKSEAEVKELWNRAWPQEAMNDLTLAFISDKSIADTGIRGLKGFLSETYPKSISRVGLGRLNYETIRAFRKKYPGPFAHRWGVAKS